LFHFAHALYKKTSTIQNIPHTNIHKLLNNLKNKAEFTITKTIIISVIAAHNIEQYISRGVF